MFELISRHVKHAMQGAQSKGNDRGSEGPQLGHLLEKSLWNLSVIARYSAWLLVILVAGFHFYKVSQYAVDVPHWDEWEFLGGSEKFPESLTWNWLIIQHNEHRIFFTRLYTWFFLKNNDWNLEYQIIVNFGFFLLLVSLLTTLIYRANPKAPSWLYPILFISQISSLSHENLLWGYQSQFHVTLIGLLVGSYFLIHERITWLRLFAGVFFLVISMYSFSSGLPGSFVILVAFFFYRLIKWKDNRQKTFLQETAMMLIAGLLWYLAAKFYLSDYKGGAIKLTYPNDGVFWEHFANLISLGFGFTEAGKLEAYSCLFLVLAPISTTAWQLLQSQTRKNLDAGTILIFVISLWVLASLATISIGRASIGLYNAKSSRYAEMSSVLVACTLYFWARTAPNHRRFFSLKFLFPLFFLFFGLKDDFRFTTTYLPIASERQKSLRCIKDTLDGKNQGDCPSAYPGNIKDRILYGQRLGLSFIEKAKNMEK